MSGLNRQNKEQLQLGGDIGKMIVFHRRVFL